MTKSAVETAVVKLCEPMLNLEQNQQKSDKNLALIGLKVQKLVENTQ